MFVIQKKGTRKRGNVHLAVYLKSPSHKGNKSQLEHLGFIRTVSDSHNQIMETCSKRQQEATCSRGNVVKSLWITSTNNSNSVSKRGPAGSTAGSLVQINSMFFTSCLKRFGHQTVHIYQQCHIAPIDHFNQTIDWKDDADDILLVLLE